MSTALQREWLLILYSRYCAGRHWVLVSSTVFTISQSLRQLRSWHQLIGNMHTSKAWSTRQRQNTQRRMRRRIRRQRAMAVCYNPHPFYPDDLAGFPHCQRTYAWNSTGVGLTSHDSHNRSKRFTIRFRGVVKVGWSSEAVRGQSLEDERNAGRTGTDRRQHQMWSFTLLNWLEELPVWSYKSLRRHGYFLYIVLIVGRRGRILQSSISNKMPS